MALPESRKKANEKWHQNNKERSNYLRYRATAKLYIKLASLEDLEVLEKLIQEAKAQKKAGD